MSLAADIAAKLCERFEGFRSRPYLCPAGVPTIGFGATYYRDGTRVTLRDAPISREDAYALLVWMVETVYLPDVLKLCPGLDTQQRTAALADFCYNLGSSRLKPSTLRRRVNDGRWGDVPTELRKWNKAAGRVMPGLAMRREAEVQLVL